MFSLLSFRAVAASTALVSGCAAAQQGMLTEVRVPGTRADLQGLADSASEGIVTSKQLRTRPLLRPGDLVEAVPGLVATQHAGEGKANQYFLRGFNLDHGTDFATFVDGMPVNLPTHGHGQGYTDLNFLIPELVESVQYRKGPYYAQEGDFASVGSARLRTVRRLDAPFGLLQAGEGRYRRVVAAGTFGVGPGDLLLAAERSGDDGPWQVAQDLRKTSVVTRYAAGTAANGWSLGVNHYEARWTSTDQVPQRAVDSGALGRFDSLDPTTGGRTRRTALTAEWDAQGRAGTSHVNAWLLRYAFDLFSNFTYATRDCEAAPLPPGCNASTQLDQFEQVDRRRAYGLSAAHTVPGRIAGREASWSIGTDLRRDNIREVGLHDTQARMRLATVRSDRVRVDAAALWAQAEVQFAPGWRGTAGLRWDHRAVRVDSSVAANSGSARDGLASPKASLVYSPTATMDLYANWGRGLHSNDARGATIRVDPRDGTTPVDRAVLLVPSTGYEVGARQQWSRGLATTVALWRLDLASELLFVGDAGTTEASRPSRRQGVEFSATWRPAPGWDLDADVSLSRARFRDADPAGKRVPGALERVVSLGATWIDGPWTLGARVRHFGDAALIEDNSLRSGSSTLVNVRAGYRIHPRAELAVDVFNLFDRTASDIRYAYASRLPGEPPFAEGTTPATVHFHPALPRTVRVGLKLFF